MKPSLTLLTAAVLGLLSSSPTAHATGFTESDVIFYGEVRKSGGGQTVLLQAGQLEMTFVNQSNPANTVTLKAVLRPTGEGTAKPYSYALKVPMAYLPDAPRINEFLAISTLPTSFKVQQIKIDGVAATLPDGSKDFYGMSFTSRATEQRLDLLVAGDSTDADHDGMTDWWERLYGLTPTLADGSEDLDEDGWTNLEEYRRGSNPAESNRVPQLVTAEIAVPESGEAGVFLQVLDSDTAPADLDIALTSIEGSGFQLKLDGAPLASAEVHHFPLTALQSGRLSIAHTTRSAQAFALPVSWTDGGDVFSGDLIVRVVSPSAIDGSEAALWLDGLNLADTGSRIGTWSDRSGNGRSAMQPTADYQPTVASHSADFSRAKFAHLFFQDSALPAG